jgi:O-antigen/teichoic acid export membrane protein
MIFGKPLALAATLRSGHALNVALNVGGIAVPVLAGLLTIPALLRYLGEERFATLALGWTIVGYFSVLDLGLGRGLTMHIARHSRAAEAPQVAALARAGRRLMLGLGFAWTALLLVLFPIVERHWPPLSTQAGSPLLAWAALVLCIPATLWMNSSTSILEAQSRFVNANAVRIPIGIGTYAGPLITALFVQDLGWIFASLLATRLLGAAVLAWQVRDQFVRDAGRLPAAELRALLKFGGWMTVSQVVGPVLVYFDRFAIAAIISAAAVTQYTIPFDLLTRLPLFPMAIMAVLFPILVQANTLNDQHSTGQAHSTARSTLQLMLVVWLCSMAFAALFGPSLLRLWIGDELGAASAPVWQWLIVGVAVNGIAHIPLTLLHSRGRTDIVAGLHLLELPVYLAAVWWALQHHGITGAAVVWTLRVTVDAILLHACARKTAPQWEHLLRTAAVAGLVALGAIGGLAWVRA